MKKAERTESGWTWSGRLRGWARWRRPRSRGDLGRWGEWLALKHLRRLGWDVVARNWTNKWGEIDLVAYDGEELVFVEVRTRRRASGRVPEDSLTTRKLGQLESLAFDFMRRFEVCDRPVRLDFIAVETRDGGEFELRHATID